MSTHDNAGWRSGGDKWEQAEHRLRRHQQIDIRMRRRQKCCWHGCLTPVGPGQPYCEKHATINRGRE